VARKSKAPALPLVPDQRRYDRWLHAVFGIFDEYRDIDPWEVVDLSEIVTGDLVLGHLEAVDLCCLTFERAELDLTRFSDHSLGWGLCFLFDSGFSSFVLTLKDDPTPERTNVRRLIARMSFLYSRCLEHRSPPILGSKSEKPPAEAERLHHVTFMLWDITALDYWSSSRDHAIMVPCLLDMLEQVIMTNSNPACIESALHGIGHASSYNRGSDVVEYVDRRRERTVDAFLAARQDLRPELLSYARAARTGSIL
jgi:hypothetical protein